MNKVFNKKNVIALIIFLSCNIIIAHFLDLLSQNISNDPLNSIEYFNPRVGLTVIFLTSVIIAPIAETLFIQYIIIEILYKIFNNKNVEWYALMTSSLLFGLLHYYNLFAIFSGFIMGLLLAYCYLYFRKSGHSFLYTVLLHAFYNFYAFIIDDFLNIS